MDPSNPSVEPAPERRTLERFPGYAVDAAGGVWSEWKQKPRGKGGGTVSFRSGEWRRLTARPAEDGYVQVKLAAGQPRPKNVFVHRLVLEAFVGPCPPGLEIRHLNDDPSDNRLDNLAYGTSRENSADQRRRGTDPAGSRNPAAKLTEAAAARILADYAAGGWTYKALAAREGVSVTAVWRVVRRRLWRHVA